MGGLIEIGLFVSPSGNGSYIESVLWMWIAQIFTYFEIGSGLNTKFITICKLIKNVLKFKITTEVYPSS